MRGQVLCYVCPCVRCGKFVSLLCDSVDGGGRLDSVRSTFDRYIRSQSAQNLRAQPRIRRAEYYDYGDRSVL